MKIKKILLLCLVGVISIQLSTSSVFAETSSSIEDIQLDSEEAFDLEIKDNTFKTTFITYDDNGIIDMSEYNKITGKVYLNGVEVEYSFHDGQKVESLTSTFTSPSINSSAAWEPVTVVRGIYIDFSPMIEFAGNVASQLLLAHCGVTAASLLGKLVKSTLSSHWTAFVNVVGDLLLDYAGGYTAKKIVNATFLYDQQNTKGLVYLGSNGTVPVIASRYANYRATLTVAGKTVSHNTGKQGGWWSSSKPY